MSAELGRRKAVVENADKIQISTMDGELFDAEIVGSDPATDIAIIKVDADGLTERDMKLAKSIEKLLK